MTELDTSMGKDQSVPNGLDGLQDLHNGLETSLTSKTLDPSSRALHADAHLNHSTDVAPPIHVSTIFRYASNPNELEIAQEIETEDPEIQVYSRHSAPSATRMEYILTSLLHAPSLTYSSGLSALHALYVCLKPPKIFLPLNRPGEGYHGSAAVIDLHRRLTGCEVLDLDDEEALKVRCGKGDVLHVETPVNPTGEARDIAHYADIAHARGALVVVDSTFAPPSLQDPFVQAADVVMHSGTKYLGGHSDMLCGVLATRDAGMLEKLREERAVLGTVMGSLEAWLGVRSLRTLGLRVERQSASAEKLVAWLKSCLDTTPTEKDSGHEEEEEDDDDGEASSVVRRCVSRLTHASLQAPTSPWLQTQMPHGYGPVFALWMRSPALARRLPSRLHLFTHATSLGGVESLIEWRVMSDKTVDGRVMRISVGVEAWEDLKADLLAGFRALCEEVEKEKTEGDERREGGGHGERGFGEAMMG